MVTDVSDDPQPACHHQAGLTMREYGGGVGYGVMEGNHMTEGHDKAQRIDCRKLSLLIKAKFALTVNIMDVFVDISHVHCKLFTVNKPPGKLIDDGPLMDRRSEERSKSYLTTLETTLKENLYTKFTMCNRLYKYIFTKNYF